MTLRELLTNTEYPKVRIGSNDGSAYFYCGEPRNFDEIHAISEVEREKCLARISESLDRIKRVEEIMLESISKKAVISTKNYLAVNKKVVAVDLAAEMRNVFEGAVNTYIKQRTADVESIRDYSKRITPWIGILEREVVETYKSISESNVLNILISGKEKGLYWSESEYINGVQEDNEDV